MIEYLLRQNTFDHFYDLRRYGKISAKLNDNFLKELYSINNDPSFWKFKLKLMDRSLDGYLDDCIITFQKEDRESFRFFYNLGMWKIASIVYLVSDSETISYLKLRS